jgi:NADPH2:quinone reductase
MRAVVISKPGDPDVLQIREVPTPVPARGEVRVRIRATAVNRADLLQRLGRYKVPDDAPADIPGIEVAGEVDAIGEGVGELAVGDRVFGLVGGGGYAEAVVAHARTFAHLPPSLSFVEGAAVPEAFITAWDAMVTQASLAAGETVLVHAGGSGVGTAAIQIALAIGARPIGTSRSPEKLARACELGLDRSVVVHDGAFADDVRAQTESRGVDVVLELVGGAYLAEDLACLAPQGRIVVVGLLQGARAEIDLGALMQRRARVYGTMLRTRPLEEKIMATRALERHLVPLFARGKLRPVIDRVLPLAEAPLAHRVVERGENFGKIVLEVTR